LFFNCRVFYFNKAEIYKSIEAKTRINMIRKAKKLISLNKHF
jgi:hypothetical protein